MNEINKLVWPNPSGIGVVPAAAVAKTATIAKTYGVIKNPPSADAVNYTYARKALAQLKSAGVNTTGTGWKAIRVTVVAGGK
jgi:NitT/TauT family transport system substrate-binding protein